jgi:hypothetical protein
MGSFDCGADLCSFREFSSAARVLMSEDGRRQFALVAVTVGWQEFDFFVNGVRVMHGLAIEQHKRFWVG